MAEAKLDGRHDNVPLPSGMMRSAIIAAPGVIELKELPLPHPGPGQVLIRLEGSGVCASNLPVWQGREWFEYPQAPGAPGHEGWGVIEALGEDVEAFEPGDRVAALSFHAYATHDVAEADAVVKLPEALAGKPFPAEPLGCAMNIFYRARIRGGETVAIVGVGFMGAMLTALCKSAGARVIAISRREDSLQAAEQMGARETIPMRDHWDVINRVKAMTNGRMCDAAIECTGLQWPLDLATELLRERGRLIVAGYHQDGPRQVNMQQWNWKGLDVINAHERDPRVYRQGMLEAIRAVETGRLDPAPLYTHKLQLQQLGEAFRLLEERPDGFMKALLLY